MRLNPEEQRLYDAFRALRKSIFDQNCYYNNDTLERFTILKPTTKEAILKIDASEEKYNRFGKAFIACIINTGIIGDKQAGIEGQTLLAFRELEIDLYNIIHSTLLQKYKDRWWFEGIPGAIRKKASDLHEETRGLVPREYGLTFIDLKEVILKEWGLFAFIGTKIKENKKSFETSLEKLNDIRNRLCHPLRLTIQPINSAEADFVAKMREVIHKILQECSLSKIGDDLEGQ